MRERTSGGRGRLVILAVIVAAGAFFLFRSGGPDKAGGPPMTAPPVRVAEAVAQDVAHFLEGMGTVTPSSDVVVVSRVDGQLMRLHFQEGRRVKAGDLLAEIDPRPLEARLGEARGALARDAAQLANARRDLERYASLVRGDFISRQQHDSQRAEVSRLEGVVAADEAAVRSAEIQLEYSRVTAPASGRTGLRNVDEGAMIRASDPEGIVRITEVSPCHVIFSLPERHVPAIAAALRRAAKEGVRVPVQAWDRDRRNLLETGALLSMDNRIESATGTIRLKAVFENADFRLYPNQFVNARMPARVYEGAVTVPSAAVRLGSRGSYVYVVDAEGVAHVRPITAGVATDELTVVDEGLEAGERVAVDGLDRLRDGARTRVTAEMRTPEAEPANP